MLLGSEETWALVYGVLNDNIGVSNIFSVNLAINYALTIGKGKLSLGLEMGADQYAVDWDQSSSLR